MLPSGFLLIDKPAGISSHHVLNLLKRQFGKDHKFGHTGTLDPFATGLLVVGVNDALRFVSYLNEDPKVYEATLKLGVATDTLDLTGTVTQTSEEISPPESRIREAAKSLEGPSLQTPPMYSAKKVEGVKLYEMARRGEEIERKAVPIRVDHFEILSISSPEISFRVSCSRGTYVRVLGADLAERLGTVGHLTALRRCAAGPFEVTEAVSLESLSDLSSHLIDFKKALSHLPIINLDVEQTIRLKQGKLVRTQTSLTSGDVALASDGSTILGIVSVTQGGELKVVRLLPT